MLGHGHLDCGMGEMQSCEDSTTDTDGPSIVPPSCCSNDYYSSDSDDYFNPVETLLASQVLFASAYVISFHENADSVNDQNFFIAQSPPIIPDDLQVLHQTFLL